MKLAFQLAYRNLIGSGLRTWLNVGVLSFAFVLIIFYNGMIDGWNQQSKLEAIEWEYGGGLLYHKNYDPLDQFTYKEGHGEILPETKNLTPVFISQGTIYPNGRMMPILVKGIDATQEIVALPTKKLQNSRADIPAIIGKRLANSAKLKVGDKVLLRWRDQNGTFDASEITIEEIFDTQVGSIDNGQIWIPIQKLWEMTGEINQATYFITEQEYLPKESDNWKFQNHDVLFKDIDEIIKSKRASGSIMYIMLLGISLLAIFDTQVLSNFIRQKEIGTYIALGNTRIALVALFTFEGSMYSFLATILGGIYGTPLLLWISSVGLGIPKASQEMGVTIPERLYPTYGLGLIMGTVLLVVISATLVSFLPARKIAVMNPVDALKGKIQ